MISKKISLLAIGFNYQEINHIQDELTKEFSHYKFDFALSIRDSLFRLNFSDYDIILLDLTSADTDKLIALKEIQQKGDSIVTLATVKSTEITDISNNFSTNSYYFIVKDTNYAAKLKECVKNIILEGTITQTTTFDRSLLEVLVNGLSEGIIFCDSTDNIVLINKTCEKFLKISRDQFLNKSIFKIPLGREFHWLSKVIQSAKSNIHLTASRKIQLNNHSIMLRFVPLYKDKNQYIGGFIYLTDISIITPFEETHQQYDTDIISMSKLFASKIIAEG